jgi:lipid-binding SYLF domain-containing protein
MGWGMLAGGDITDYLIVLTTQEAVESVISGTQVQLGTEIDMAVGPVGRGTKVDISTNGSNNTNKIVPLPSLHPAYCYAHSKGIFIGMSLESSIVKVRHDVNANFYGVSKITPDQILDRPQPRAAQPLYHALQRAYMTEIPQDGFRPSQLFT